MFLSLSYIRHIIFHIYFSNTHPSIWINTYVYTIFKKKKNWSDYVSGRDFLFCRWNFSIPNIFIINQSTFNTSQDLQIYTLPPYCGNMPSMSYSTKGNFLFYRARTELPLAILLQ